MTTKIHPTAIVDKNAIIGEGSEIGAYAVIGPKVTLGNNCWIGNHANITGNTTIGENSKIYHFASVGESPQDKKYNGEDTKLLIGKNNTIREFCTINTGTVQGNNQTVIGDNNWIMAYVHIAHDCIVGDNTILANNVTLAGHVIVGDWAIIGGLSPVHQFTIIGAHTMVGGQTAISQDVPPYIMASSSSTGPRAEPKGVNAEGLRRRGFTAAQIDNIKYAYKLLYRNGLSYSEAKSTIEEMSKEHSELKLFCAFFKASTRGIVR
jgi:UDP-N-acetylglucosamine acyltransferase